MNPSRALSIALIMLSGQVWAQQAPAFRPLQPTDATTAIIEAFHSYPIVALGEGPHGNEQGHAFRLTLLAPARSRVASKEDAC